MRWLLPAPISLRARKPRSRVRCEWSPSGRNIVRGLFLSRNSRSSEIRQPALARYLVDRLLRLASVVLGELVVVFLSLRSHVRLRRAKRKMVDLSLSVGGPGGF